METLFIVDQEFDLILLESLCFNKKNKQTNICCVLYDKKRYFNKQFQLNNIFPLFKSGQNISFSCVTA